MNLSLFKKNNWDLVQKFGTQFNSNFFIEDSSGEVLVEKKDHVKQGKTSYVIPRDVTSEQLKELINMSLKTTNDLVEAAYGNNEFHYESGCLY